MNDRTIGLYTSALARVLIVEPDTSVESALEQVARELDCTLARVESVPQLLAHARGVRPHVAVLDVDFQGPLGGIRVAEALRQELGTRVVYLSAHEDVQTVRRATLTDPYGYLLRPVRAFDLRSCLELALHRAGGTATAVHRSPAPTLAALSALTTRERAVLRLIAQGHTSKDIAGKLDIAKPTVDTYRARLSEKLGGRSRAELVQLAQAAGLLD